MSNKRRIEPEILDTLSSHDPQAIRSRKDLKRINFFMGNNRWIQRSLNHIQKKAQQPLNIFELGAGDGTLLSILAQSSQHNFTGIDLIERPNNLPPKIHWKQDNIFNLTSLPKAQESPTIIICNLTLHHFEPEQLKSLNRLFQQANHILTVEPHRKLFPKIMGYMAYPFINSVTRHDMIVSINAGFQKGELNQYFSNKKNIAEQTTYRGAIRNHFS